MPVFTSPYVILALVVAWLASVAGGAEIGHRVTHNAWLADQARVEQAAIEHYKATDQQQQLADIAYQHQKEIARVRQEAASQSVARIVERPVYRNVCLDDDGLRAVNDALAGSAAAPRGPDRALRGPDAAH